MQMMSRPASLCRPFRRVCRQVTARVRVRVQVQAAVRVRVAVRVAVRAAVRAAVRVEVRAPVPIRPEFRRPLPSQLEVARRRRLRAPHLRPERQLPPPSSPCPVGWWGRQLQPPDPKMRTTTTQKSSPQTTNWKMTPLNWWKWSQPEAPWPTPGPGQPSDTRPEGPNRPHSIAVVCWWPFYWFFYSATATKGSRLAKRRTNGYGHGHGSRRLRAVSHPPLGPQSKHFVDQCKAIDGCTPHPQLFDYIFS